MGGAGKAPITIHGHGPAEIWFPVSKSSRDRVEFNAQTALAAGLARTRAAGHHQHQAKLVEELEIGVVVHVQTGTNLLVVTESNIAK